MYNSKRVFIYNCVVYYKSVCVLVLLCVIIYIYLYTCVCIDNIQ